MRLSTLDRLDPVWRRPSIRQNLGNHSTTGRPVAFVVSNVFRGSGKHMGQRDRETVVEEQGHALQRRAAGWY